MTILNGIYIAGPMSGYSQFNFPEFDLAVERLNEEFEGEGRVIFSPADHDRMLLGKPADWYPTEEDAIMPWKAWNIPNAPDLRTMLGADLKWICENASTMYMLPGWERSFGARTEHALAVALGLEIIYQ